MTNAFPYNKVDSVVLEPDVLAYFPNAEAVNHALRTLITLFPDRQPSAKT